MKLTTRCNELIKAVQSCSRVIVSASPSPVLTNILIDCNSKKDEGMVRLFATDLEMYYEVFVPASIEEPGEVMVSSKTFTETLGSFSDEGEITISCNTENFNIEIRGSNIASKAECTIFGLAPDDFPSLPTFDKGENFSFKYSLSKLQSMIRDTIYAASTDQVKPAYCGMCLKILTTGLRAVSTDGKRLAFCEHTITGTELKEHNELIIMSKVLNEIAKCHYDENNDEIEIVIFSNQIAFKSKTYSYYARLIEGKFPDYNQVIPKDCKIKVSGNISEMSNRLRKTLSIAKENSNTIKLNVGSSSIIYTAKSTRVGSMKIESPITMISGSDIEINFNAKFLLDLLATIKSEECILEFTNPQAPVKVYPKQEITDESHVHILMPVRPGFGA